MTVLKYVLYAIGWILLLTFAIGGKSAAPWVRTKKPQRQALLNGFPLKPGSLVYDIGCGDGAVLFDLADRNPGIRGVGFEIALLPFLLAAFRKARSGDRYKNLKFRYRDFFGQSVADADAVFLFLLPPAYPRVAKKLGAEIRPDALVAVEGWPFPGVAIERVIEKTAETMPIYIYRGSALRAALIP